MSFKPTDPYQVQKDKDGSVYRTKDGRTISPAPRASLEAWQITLEHEGLVAQFVNQYFGAGIKLDDNPEKIPHRGPDWMRFTEDHDDLLQEARVALHKAAKTWNPIEGELSTYAAYPVAQALDRAVESILKRPKTADKKSLRPVRLGTQGEIAELEDADYEGRQPVALRTPDFSDDIVEGGTGNNCLGTPP